MLLFEFDAKQNSAMTAQIVALTNQLEQEINDGEVDPNNYSVDDLLDYFQTYDVILDTDDLYNMIKVAPLKDLIHNIQGNKVVFKGHGDIDSLDQPEDQDKKTVKQMAKHALKK